MEELRKRSKWREHVEGPKVGQVVVITDDLLPRDSWKLGRITQIINEEKQTPRQLLIRDAVGRVFDRHITGIVPIETDLDD